MESLDNFLEIIKEIRESPLVESPGKLCKIKIVEERLTEIVLFFRRIDSVFPGNSAKIISHSLYLER